MAALCQRLLFFWGPRTALSVHPTWGLFFSTKNVKIVCVWKEKKFRPFIQKQQKKVLGFNPPVMLASWKKTRKHPPNLTIRRVFFVKRSVLVKVDWIYTLILLAILLYQVGPTFIASRCDDLDTFRLRWSDRKFHPVEWKMKNIGGPGPKGPSPESLTGLYPPWN